jgi:glutamate carboxypeptidase
MRALLGWLKPRQAAMARLLGQFVRAESSSFDKAALDLFGHAVAAEWKRRGATVTLLPQKRRGDHIRAVLDPVRKRAGGQVLVLGHLDTVYSTGTIVQMPFRVSQGRAWGPGVFDMKAGLVIALYAIDGLTAAGFVPNKRIVFLWTSDEEIGSETSRAAIEREARRSDAVLVLEPALGPKGLVKTGRKGVGEFEIAATGRAAHAGLNPEDGINAIEEIALQVARVRQWNQPRSGITVNAGVIQGGTRSNVVPERARVLIDVRAPRPGDIRALERKFRALSPILKCATLHVAGGFNRPPMERKMSASLFAKARALSKEMGITLGEAFVGGASDGNFTAALGIPTLDGLGAIGEGAHSPRENVVLRSLPERAALLAGLLKKI